MKLSKNSDEQRQSYRKLLDELRTIVPGVQVLFAFLLMVPFASRFEQVDSLGRVIFTCSLIGVVTTTVLFFVPAAYHRLSNPSDRQERLRFRVKTTLVGLALFVLSVSCAVFVVVRPLFVKTAIGVVIASATILLTTSAWFLIPIYHSKQSKVKFRSLRVYLGH